MTIEGTGIEQLGQLTAELTKQGVGFKALLNDDPNRPSWTVTMTGAF